MPTVAMSPTGAYTIVWTSFGQDNQDNPLGNPSIPDYGVYARMYNADGTPYAMAPIPFRVNGTTLGDQVAPAISRDAATGNAAVVWVGPSSSSNVIPPPTAIFERTIDPPPVKAAAQTSTTPTTTTLVASANPAVFGQTVTFTATVKTTGSGTLTGTVTFQNGINVLGTAVLNSSGQATYST